MDLSSVSFTCWQQGNIVVRRPRANDVGLQGTTEGVERAWKILDRLALETCKNIEEGDMESQVRERLVKGWLNGAFLHAWRLLAQRAGT